MLGYIDIVFQKQRQCEDHKRSVASVRHNRGVQYDVWPEGWGHKYETD